MDTQNPKKEGVQKRMSIQGIQIWCSKTREEVERKKKREKIFRSNLKPDSKTEEDPNEYFNTSKKPRYQNEKKTQMGT